MAGALSHSSLGGLLCGKTLLTQDTCLPTVSVFTVCGLLCPTQFLCWVLSAQVEVRERKHLDQVRHWHLYARSVLSGTVALLWVFGPAMQKVKKSPLSPGIGWRMGEGVFEKKRKEGGPLVQVGGIGGGELAKRVGVGDRCEIRTRFWP